MLVGYARVSTAEQNPDHQTDALARAGVARGDIHVDHASGTKASRPKLDLILRILRDGGAVQRFSGIRWRSPRRSAGRGAARRSGGGAERGSSSSSGTHRPVGERPGP